MAHFSEPFLFKLRFPSGDLALRSAWESDTLLPIGPMPPRAMGSIRDFSGGNRLALRLDSRKIDRSGFTSMRPGFFNNNAHVLKGNPLFAFSGMRPSSTRFRGRYFCHRCYRALLRASYGRAPPNSARQRKSGILSTVAEAARRPPLRIQAQRRPESCGWSEVRPEVPASTWSSETRRKH